MKSSNLIELEGRAMSIRHRDLEGLKVANAQALRPKQAAPHQKSPATGPQTILSIRVLGFQRSSVSCGQLQHITGPRLVRESLRHSDKFHLTATSWRRISSLVNYYNGIDRVPDKFLFLPEPEALLNSNI